MLPVVSVPFVDRMDGTVEFLVLLRTLPARMLPTFYRTVPFFLVQRLYSSQVRVYDVTFP